MTTKKESWEEFEKEYLDKSEKAKATKDILNLMFESHKLAHEAGWDAARKEVLSVLKKELSRECKTSLELNHSWKCVGRIKRDLGLFPK